MDQFILRSILYRLAWACRSDYNPSWGWHYKTFFEQLATRPDISQADLTAAALLYADIYLQPVQARYQKVFAYEPVTPAYQRLQFVDMTEVAVLPPILDMMDFLIGELRTVRMRSPLHRGPMAPRLEGAKAVEDEREPRTTRSPAARHRLQSFWHGGALSPYELFCLKSFVDHGYGIDLYTYDANLVVPAGVRICDAAEVARQDEIFVYQAEGFGKGSPSAFSNLFRYKLLLEKGGWWIDTDVVCLTDRIPTVSEFFARQDADFVNGAIMYFEPAHPVMAKCLAQAMNLGPNVKWGDTGPRLLTRALQEAGCLDRALPAAVCYPVHYTHALDILRPSSTALLAPQVESSLFLHLWNSMLVHRGVEKDCRPPKRSLLRALTDKHPVEGWSGEYDERTLEHATNRKAQLDAFAEEKSRLHASLALQVATSNRLTAELDARTQENIRLQATLERSVAHIEAIRASTIWRLTEPLRAASQARVSWPAPAIAGLRASLGRSAVRSPG